MPIDVIRLLNFYYFELTILYDCNIAYILYRDCIANVILYTLFYMNLGVGVDIENPKLPIFW